LDAGALANLGPPKTAKNHGLEFRIYAARDDYSPEPPEGGTPNGHPDVLGRQCWMEFIIPASLAAMRSPRTLLQADVLFVGAEFD
jgi:hypothetical protein